MPRWIRESLSEAGRSEEGERKRLTSRGGVNNLNLQGVMIWRTFTRNLRHRVQERRGERTSVSRATTDGHRSLGSHGEFEPTYQLCPSQKPYYAKYKESVSIHLASLLCEQLYDPEKCLQLSKTISEEVLAIVKNCRPTWPQRYKCIVTVTLGQKKGQGVQVSSLCAWDQQNDNYVTCSYHNSSLFCVVTLFGIYHE